MTIDRRVSIIDWGSIPPPPPPGYTHFRFVVNPGLEALPWDFGISPAKQAILAVTLDDGRQGSVSFDKLLGVDGYINVGGDFRMICDGIHIHSASAPTAIPDISEQLAKCDEHVDEGTIDSVGDVALSGDNPLTDNINVEWEECHSDGTRDDDP